ncbi:hypothetical protein [Ruegeria sp. ANG-S4]|uniref:hypothetical protein n=1 Tax=Ruegeria sp. ANG-S4 TaxID=1577904 RepID=UPI001269C073|nr:hypothetical protein [Ruegeria sp. ANG-S4]
MADITELTELAVDADGDELVIYDTSEGSKNSKKVTRAALLKDAPIDLRRVTLTGSTGSVVTDIQQGGASVNPVDLAAGASESIVVAVNGFQTTDNLSFALTSPLPPDHICQGFISALDQVTFEFFNASAVTIFSSPYIAKLTAISFEQSSVYLVTEFVGRISPHGYRCKIRPINDHRTGRAFCGTV